MTAHETKTKLFQASEHFRQAAEATFSRDHDDHYARATALVEEVYASIPHSHDSRDSRATSPLQPLALSL